MARREVSGGLAIRPRASAFIVAGLASALALGGNSCRRLRPAPESLYPDWDADTTVLHPDPPPSLNVGSAGGEPYPSPSRPWVAIIIDDFGPSGTVALVPGFAALPGEITLSIIPGNPGTAAVVRQADAAGQEYFVHLPMEPNHHTAMSERYMVMAGCDSAALADIMLQVAAEIPGAAGLNNHMGSYATADPNLMGRLAGELRRRSWVFVDSRTARQSAGYPVMSRMGLPALWRDVFLDNRRDPEHISAQLDELAALARRRGWAVGIGHACRETLEVLRRRIPELQRGGIRFVSAGLLVRTVWDLRQGLAALSAKPEAAR